MSDKNTMVLKKLIEVELSRLGMMAPDTDVTSFVVNDQDELPQGWVQVADDYESCWCGPAGEILESLKVTLADEMDANGEHHGILVVYEALKTYAGSNLQNAATWRDYHEYIGIEIGGLGLIVLRTNGGLRWSFAPIETDYVTFSTIYDFSQQYGHACEALDAACDFVARWKSKGE